MNKVILIGNLVADPEISTSANGTDTCRFKLAVSRRTKEETDFFSCTAFGKLGTDVIGKYSKKGNKIGITGRIETRTVTSDDGRNTIYWNVIVDDCELLGTKASSPELKEETNNGELPF